MVEPVKDQVGRIEIALKLFFGHQVEVADNIRQVEHFREMRRPGAKGINGHRGAAESGAGQ